MFSMHRWWRARVVAALAGTVLGSISGVLLGRGIVGAVLAIGTGIVAGAIVSVVGLRRDLRGRLGTSVVAISIDRRLAWSVLAGWALGILAMIAITDAFAAPPAVRLALIGGHTALCSSTLIRGVALGQPIDRR